MKEFREEGVEGLNPKQKGQPSMSKKSNKQKRKEEEKLTREEELERENELLRLENAYLKNIFYNPRNGQYLGRMEDNTNSFKEGSFIFRKLFSSNYQQRGRLIAKTNKIRW